MEKKGFFTRLADLWRGFWGLKLNGAEARNAELVYHNAIAQRTHQEERLKDAVGRLAYLRNRVDAALMARREDLSLVEAALTDAARMDDDMKAMALIRKQRTLHSEIERLENELDRLSQQTENSKQSLVEVRKAVQHLKNEQDEMLARKQHAAARLEIASALQNTLGDTSSTDQALENVRESIIRLETRAGLSTDAAEHPTGDVSIAALRREASEQADREELQDIKRSLGKNLLTEGIGDDVLAPLHVEQPHVAGVSQ